LHSNLIKGEDLLRREDLPREEELLAQYNEAAAREIGRQSAFLGPHRDESVFLIGGKEARAFASQGQARSLLLALKLGVIELIYERREELPLILLDDVDSELDQERSQALFELIKSEKGQVFVTGTSLSGFKQACSGTYQLMRIESGRISLE
jgi:DNA replication and repair protein RecF